MARKADMSNLDIITRRQALAWLHFKRGCPVVLFERDPVSNGLWRPDVLGITNSRKRIEVELKTTLSDFRANENKQVVQRREEWIAQWPWKFFFFVPQSMVASAIAESPPWAGILSRSIYGVYVVRESPINNCSKRMTVKQCIRTAYLLSNQLISMCHE